MGEGGLILCEPRRERCAGKSIGKSLRKKKKVTQNDILQREFSSFYTVPQLFEDEILNCSRRITLRQLIITYNTITVCFRLLTSDSAHLMKTLHVYF